MPVSWNVALIGWLVTGYLMTHEWAIYIFDALLMAGVLALTSTWYLGKIEAITEDHADGHNLVNRTPTEYIQV